MAVGKEWKKLASEADVLGLGIEVHVGSILMTSWDQCVCAVVALRMREKEKSGKRDSNHQPLALLATS